MKTNSWTTAAKPKAYRQAPTHWFYEETVIESEARTAVLWIWFMKI